jgi:hypothetical protein
MPTNATAAREGRSPHKEEETIGADEMNKPNADPAGRLDQPAVPATGRRWIVSVFGDITRRGSWPSRDRLSPVAMFGDIDLDFRQAGMPAGHVAINAVAPFGNIDVLVPDGVQVDVGGATLLGSKKDAVGGATENESAAVIRVRGFSLFGSVKVSS